MMIAGVSNLPPRRLLAWATRRSRARELANNKEEAIWEPGRESFPK
jgi:hypothetical protein